MVLLRPRIHLDLVESSGHSDHRSLIAEMLPSNSPRRKHFNGQPVVRSGLGSCACLKREMNERGNMNVFVTGSDSLDLQIREARAPERVHSATAISAEDRSCLPRQPTAHDPVVSLAHRSTSWVLFLILPEPKASRKSVPARRNILSRRSITPVGVARPLQRSPPRPGATGHDGPARTLYGRRRGA